MHNSSGLFQCIQNISNTLNPGQIPKSLLKFCKYRMSIKFGGELNLANWRFVTNPPLYLFNVFVYVKKSPTRLKIYILTKFKFGGLVTDRQFAKFSSPPNLIDIRNLQNFSRDLGF